MVKILQNNQEYPTCYLCKLDPRTKLLSGLLLILSGVLIPSGHFLEFTLIYAWVFLITLFSHQTLWFILKSILKIYPMIFFLTFLLPFNSINSGHNVDILFSLKSIHIYYSGINNFIDLNLRSILIFSSSLIVITETPIRAILKTLTILHIPKWVEAIVIYMQRFIIIISIEFHRMHLAFAARSFNMSLFAKTKAVAKMSGIYFSRLIDRSERSHLAMISRGFYGEIYTRYQLSWRFIDSVVVFVHLTVFTLFILGWYY